MVVATLILLAFFLGLVFRQLAYPPLLGYLAAGFIAHGFNIGDASEIEPIADIGILILLFTIGLKLNLRELIAPQVWGVTLAQMGIAIPATAAMLLGLAWLVPVVSFEDTSTAWTLAFALAFSSTVFAVKMFDERGENASFHAAVAIGILVFQDLIAVGYLVATSDKPPLIYALGLVAIPLLRPLLFKVMKFCGHGELFTLFGVATALGGAALFELVHLKAGLGALAFGVLLSGTGKTNELYKALISFKDLLLIGFFIQIGYYGLPTWDMLLVAFWLSLLIFIRPVLYFLLLTAFKLRARTALLTSLALFNYSEFGLIVAALAASSGHLEPSWVTTMAVSLAISFVIATPFNKRVHELYARLSPWLAKLERKQSLLQDTPVKLGDASILILGMGRVGVGAYEYLHGRYPGDVIGLEENLVKAQLYKDAGFYCEHADASDRSFWEQADLDQRSLILVSLSNHAENMEVVKLMKQFNYQGKLAVVSHFIDEQKELIANGCITFNLFAEAGYGFAEHVLSQVAETKASADSLEDFEATADEASAHQLR